MVDLVGLVAVVVREERRRKKGPPPRSQRRVVVEGEKDHRLEASVEDR